MSLIPHYGIGEIARDTAYDIGQIALCFGTTVWFMTPSGTATFCALSLTACITGIALRVFSALVIAFARSKNLRFVCYTACQTLQGMVMAIPVGSTFGIWVHEMGHVLAIYLTMIPSKVRVIVKPLEGGMTSRRDGPLTRFGHFLGMRNSRILITAGGALLALTVAWIAFERGCAAIKKGNHGKGASLITSSLVELINHVYYALSAIPIGPSAGNSHDFVSLWGYGTHPAKVATLMIAPFAVSIFFKLRALFDSLEETAG